MAMCLVNVKEGIKLTLLFFLSLFMINHEIYMIGSDYIELLLSTFEVLGV